MKTPSRRGAFRRLVDQLAAERGTTRTQVMRDAGHHPSALLHEPRRGHRSDLMQNVIDELDRRGRATIANLRQMAPFGLPTRLRDRGSSVVLWTEAIRLAVKHIGDTEPNIDQRSVRVAEDAVDVFFALISGSAPMPWEDTASGATGSAETVANDEKIVNSEAKAARSEKPPKPRKIGRRRRDSVC